MWVSSLRIKGEARLGSSECPVSLTAGESAAWVEDFLAHRAFGWGGGVLEWPARRVEAFAVLWKELTKLERNKDGE